jgi:hypothetical protein
LDGWEDLGVALEEDQGWNPSFKLQALHLLGMRLSASNYERYMVARSSSDPQLKVWLNQVLNGHFPIPIPDDDAGARLAFQSIIKKSESRLKVLLKRHKKRYDADYAARSDLAAFDSSDEGERFRKYEFSAGRSFSRALKDAVYYRKSGELPPPSRRGSRGNAPKPDDGDRGPVEPGVVRRREARSYLRPERENITAMTEVALCEASAPWQSEEYYVFAVDTAEITGLLHPLVGDEAELNCTTSTDDPVFVASGAEGGSETASEPPAEPRPASQPIVATRAAAGPPVVGLLGLILFIVLMALGAVRSAERHVESVNDLPKAQSPDKQDPQSADSSLIGLERSLGSGGAPHPRFGHLLPGGAKGKGTARAFADCGAHLPLSEPASIPVANSCTPRVSSRGCAGDADRSPGKRDARIGKTDPILILRRMNDQEIAARHDRRRPRPRDPFASGLMLWTRSRSTISIVSSDRATAIVLSQFGVERASQDAPRPGSGYQPNGFRTAQRAGHHASDEVVRRSSGTFNAFGFAGAQRVRRE